MDKSTRDMLEAVATCDDMIANFLILSAQMIKAAVEAGSLDSLDGIADMMLSQSQVMKGTCAQLREFTADD